MKNIFKFSQQPEFENASLIVAWDKDAGQLSPRVIDYLNKKINSRSFCEIEPVDFFSLAGVTIEKDIAQFPEGKFYCGQRSDLVIFKGSEPAFERYRFLNGICDLAQRRCKIKQLYTISGTISSIAHTEPRKIWAVFNQQQFQNQHRGFGLEDMTWEGKPAISSFLLWVAQRKGIPGVSLWTQIPFYLAAGEDFQAIKLTLSFLDRRFNLELDFKELDEQINKQNTKIEQLRQQDPEINRHIATLESGLSLSEEEQLELIKAVSEFLEKG
ncbi:MAG: PAC2 family protein [Sedimentisphaerales bacterium]